MDFTFNPRRDLEPVNHNWGNVIILFVRIIICAAAFCICCNLLNCILGMPYRRLLNVSNLEETKACTSLSLLMPYPGRVLFCQYLLCCTIPLCIFGPLVVPCCVCQAILIVHYCMFQQHHLLQKLNAGYSELMTQYHY